jgi:hypothetical protein
MHYLGASHAAVFEVFKKKVTLYHVKIEKKGISRFLLSVFFMLVLLGIHLLLQEV